MLGLILLYFIGKYFYRLAEEYDKSKWGFAILGVVVYYASTFVAAILYYAFGFFDIDTTNRYNDLAVSFAALPFGILSCYLLYYFLEKNWKKQKQTNTSNVDGIDDIGTS